MKEWISVEERLPPIDDSHLDYDSEVVVWSQTLGVVSGVEYHAARPAKERRFVRDGEAIPDVTHWMPLPNPPAQEPR